MLGVALLRAAMNAPTQRQMRSHEVKKVELWYALSVSRRPMLRKDVTEAQFDTGGLVGLSRRLTSCHVWNIIYNASDDCGCQSS